MRRKVMYMTRKTAVMKLIEVEYGRPIEELITQGSLREMSRKFRVSHTTINNWLARIILLEVEVPD